MAKKKIITKNTKKVVKRKIKPMAKSKVKEEPKKQVEKPVSKVSTEPLKVSKPEIETTKTVFETKAGDIIAAEIHNELVNKNLANKG